MAKPSIKSRSHSILALRGRCGAMLPIIWSPYPVNRMSRSWKQRRSPATSSPAVCHVVLLFLTGLSNARVSLCCDRICIPNSRLLTHRMAESFHAVTPREAKRHETMIGEGTQSTNQRRHNYVQENVEVAFFTDPTVCIGCKACEVACKEWNEVPDDGFTWVGNSYDNTGSLGASTWRHVLFLEQDQRKGQQVVSSSGDGEDPFRWIFLSDVC